MSPRASAHVRRKWHFRQLRNNKITLCRKCNVIFFSRRINKKKTFTQYSTRAFIYSPQTWVVRAMETHWVFFPSLYICTLLVVRRISLARTASYFVLNYITVSRLCSTTTSMANYPRVHFILEFLSRLVAAAIYTRVRTASKCVYFSLVFDCEKSHSSWPHSISPY